MTTTNIPTNVVERYALRANITIDEALNVFSRLEDFLAQGARRSLSPDQEVDAAWHEFILHTRDYAAFCQDRFGHFIHHVPSSRRDGNANCGTGDHCGTEG